MLTNPTGNIGISVIDKRVSIAGKLVKRTPKEMIMVHSHGQGDFASSDVRESLSIKKHRWSPGFFLKRQPGLPQKKRQILTVRNVVLCSGLLLFLVLGWLGASIVASRMLTPAAPIQKWVYHPNGSALFTPVVSENTVYVVSENGITSTLAAVDALSGQEKWSYRSKDLIFFSPIIENGLAYVVADDSVNELSTVYALDTISGRLKWSSSLDSPVALFSPLFLVGRNIYIFTNNGTLSAFNALSGGLQWTRRLGEKAVYAPAVNNGMIYVVSMDAATQISKVSAVEALSGHLAWSYREDKSTWIVSQPIVTDRMVAVISDNSATQESQIDAIDVLSGRLKWSSHIGKSLFAVSSLKVIESMIYAEVAFVGDQQTEFLLVLDIFSGRQLWVKSGLDGGLSWANGNIYVYTTEHTLLALDGTSGQQRWLSRSGVFSSSSYLPAFPANGPFTNNGVIYVHTTNGTLYALDAQSGREKWSYHTKGGIGFSLAVTVGMLYIFSSGDVYAIQPPGTTS